jgi:hypothetical protein
MFINPKCEKLRMEKTSPNKSKRGAFLCAATAQLPIVIQSEAQAWVIPNSIFGFFQSSCKKMSLLLRGISNGEMVQFQRHPMT